MKNILFLLFFAPCFSFAEQTKTIFNPFTGKLDYITSLSSTSLSEKGVFGQVIVKHADGTQVSYSTTTNTDQARGRLFLDSLAACQSSDTIHLSADTFSLVHSTADLKCGSGGVSVVGEGIDKTIVYASDPRFIFKPADNSILDDMTIQCISVNDFCLPIGTEDRGSTGVRGYRLKLVGPRDVIYADNNTAVDWSFYDSEINNGWDGIVQQNTFSSATYMGFHDCKIGGVANRSNDDGGAHSHGILAYNPKGTIELWNTPILASNGTVENVDVDISGGHVRVYGSSFTATGPLALHVRNDDLGGTFKDSVDTVLISSMCVFNNQTSPRSFESTPLPFRMGGLQGILSLDPITGCFRVGDDDNLADNNYFQWCTNSGDLTVNISGDFPFYISGARLHSGVETYFNQIFMPDGVSVPIIGQSLNIKDNGDAFNSPQMALSQSSSIYMGLRLNANGSLLFNSAGGATAAGTGAKRNMCVEISTTGAFPTDCVPGASYSLGGTLYSFFNSTGNNGTTETDLYRHEISSNTLFRASDTFNFSYFGTATNSATATTQLKIYYDTTTIFDSGALAMTAAGTFRINGDVVSTSTPTISCIVGLEGSGFSGLSAPQTFTTVGNVSKTASHTIKFTATRAGVGAASNDILGQGGKIQNWPSP